MQISVVICTRNRAEQLRRTLETASDLQVPQNLSWELLVVDNGSSDHTPEVVQCFVDRLPIRIVNELRPGLSNARNRGVSEANGAYICWTDDDVLIDARWLASYAGAFDRHPNSCYFGGPIELILEKPTPSWLEKSRAILGPLLAERLLGDAPMRLDPGADIVPYGANYAVRSAEQRANLYDPNLGVSPRQRRLGEETELMATLHQRGFDGWWVPNARVRHVIPVERQTLEYFLDYQGSAGESAAYIASKSLHYPVRRSLRLSSPFVSRAPIHLWCLMAGHLMLYGLLRWFGSPSAWIRHWLNYGYYRGAIMYWRAVHRDGQS